MTILNITLTSIVPIELHEEDRVRKVENFLKYLSLIKEEDGDFSLYLDEIIGNSYRLYSCCGLKIVVYGTCLLFIRKEMLGAVGILEAHKRRKIVHDEMLRTNEKIFKLVLILFSEKKYAKINYIFSFFFGPIRKHVGYGYRAF